MKRIPLISFFLLICLSSAAQLRFNYNLSTETLFDNRECDRGGNIYTHSGTIFGTNVIPEVGFCATTGSEDGLRSPAHHHFMVGVEIQKDFGSRQTIGETFKELTIYYSLQKKLGKKCDFTLTSGIFPRYYSKEDYSEVFFSDSTLFYDTNFEGLLMRFEQPSSSLEIGCDWIGMKDREERERFMVFSSGQYRIKPWFKVGYSAYMYHFASSEEVYGVVDNTIINPYLKFDFADNTGMQELSAKLNYILTFQRDRIVNDRPSLPMGGEFVFVARKWDVSIKNSLYFGQDLMPLYNQKDSGGIKYGNNLYFGDPHYRVRPDGAAAKTPAVMDHVEVFWEPEPAPGLKIRVGAIAYFNKGFSGWNQVVSVLFNMDELRSSLKRIK